MDRTLDEALQTAEVRTGVADIGIDSQLIGVVAVVVGNFYAVGLCFQRMLGPLQAASEEAEHSAASAKEAARALTLAEEQLEHARKAAAADAEQRQQTETKEGAGVREEPVRQEAAVAQGDSERVAELEAQLREFVSAHRALLLKRASRGEVEWGALRRGAAVSARWRSSKRSRSSSR
eukprot:COSAG01_NODE_1448_length_10275_cov_57.853872_3_plen_178_part_00